LSNFVGCTASDIRKTSHVVYPSGKFIFQRFLRAIGAVKLTGKPSGDNHDTGDQPHDE
jgi:hypothetical protein